jgi:uncharacterized membrane protein
MIARAIPAALLLLASFILNGCGAVFVGFVSNQGVPTTVTGKVLASSLLTINDRAGQPLTVTRVILSAGGLSNTLTFCGDQQVHFPLNATVKIEFTSNIDCMSLVDGVIISTDPPNA